MTVLVNEHGDKQYKVLVGVPSGEMVHADFAYDWARMVGYTQYVNPDISLLLYSVKGTYLPRARNGLANVALEKDCTHLLFLDADMRFPKDTLLRLLGHGKPVVCANYPTRQHPILPTALDEQRQPMFDSPESLTEAGTAGMGVMLIDTDVLRALEKPWFAIGYSKQTDDYSGEDTFFCQQARKSGFAIWIDGPLSEQVEHCGGFRYAMTHARMTRDAAMNGAQ